MRMDIMKKIFILILPILFLCITTAYSEVPEEEINLPALASASNISIDRAVIAVYVEEREPIDEGVSFDSSVGKLYCFTHLMGAESETFIRHVWYYKDKEMADVLLTIKSSSYRTYSSKNILSFWTGDWMVEILGEDDTLLKTVNFTIE